MAELTSGFKIKIRKDFSIIIVFPHIAEILNLGDEIVKMKEERKIAVVDKEQKMPPILYRRPLPYHSAVPSQSDSGWSGNLLGPMGYY